MRRLMTFYSTLAPREVSDEPGRTFTHKTLAIRQALEIHIG